MSDEPDQDQIDKVAEDKDASSAASAQVASEIDEDPMDAFEAALKEADWGHQPC